MKKMISFLLLLSCILSISNTVIASDSCMKVINNKSEEVGEYFVLPKYIVEGSVTVANDNVQGTVIDKGSILTYNDLPIYVDKKAVIEETPVPEPETPTKPPTPSSPSGGGGSSSGGGGGGSSRPIPTPTLEPEPTEEYGVTYTLSEDGVLTVSGEGDMKDWAYYHIPWYDDRKSIKSIVVEEGITSIGSNAFYGCLNLTSVTLPLTLKCIGEHAFSDCESLIEVSIPESVISIGEYAFDSCYALNEVIIPKSVKCIEPYTFRYCSSIGSVILPDELDTIGEYAFYYCENISRIVIPNNVKTIGSYAFRGTSLDCVALPKKLESIGYNVFNTITQLICGFEEEKWNGINNSSCYTDVKFYIDYGFCGEDILWGLDFNNTLRLNGSGEMTSYNSYEDIPWYNVREKVKSLIIDEGVTQISPYSFYGLSNLKYVFIPQGIVYIKDYAFYGCTSLEKIILTDSVFKISDTAFEKCNTGIEVFYNGSETAWTSIRKSESLPEIVTVRYYNECGIEDNLIWSLDNNNTLTIMGYGDIPDYTRYNTIWGKQDYDYGQRAVEEIDICEGITGIGNFSFYNAYELTEVSLPQTLKSIGDSAFSGCENLGNIDIPEDVNYIGARAFWSCYGMKNVKMPKSLSVIREYTFAHCRYLESVIIPAGVTTIEQRAFESCRMLKSLRIPAEVTIIMPYSFSNCWNLRRISLPKNITEIQEYAFNQCNSMNEVYYGNTEENWYENIVFGQGNACLNIAHLIPEKIDFSDFEIIYSKTTSVCYVEEYANLPDTAILAEVSYAENGEVDSIIIHHKSNGEISFYVNKSAGKSIKLMLWESLDNMIPLSDYVCIDSTATLF